MFWLSVIYQLELTAWNTNTMWGS